MKGTKRPWTRPQLKRALKELRAGVPVQQVAADMGRSPSSVCHALSVHCGTTVTEIKRARGVQREPILRAYVAKEITSETAAARAGLTVRGWLGYVRRQGKGLGRGGRLVDGHWVQHPPQVAIRCAKLRGAGKTYAEISRHTRVPTGSLRALIDRGQRLLAAEQGAAAT